MKKFIIFLIFANLCFANTIYVAVAANVSYAFDELKTKFNEIYPNIQVLPTFSGSGTLTSQIKNQAPFSVFISADTYYPDLLYKDNLTSQKTKIYAKGSLVLVSFSKKNINIFNLTNKDITKIAVANPKLAPYGKATMQVLQNLNLLKDVEKKIVFANNISQTLAYSKSAADAGFVAKSSIFSPNLKNQNFSYADINSSLYEDINQGIVLIKKYQNDKSAKAFYDFILSKEAKKIFKKYGYR